MSAAAQKIEPEQDTVASAASMAMHQAAGDINEAAKILEARVRKDRVLKTAIMDPLIQYACHQAVCRQQRERRADVWNPPQVREGMSRADKIAILARSNLMMFALPIGGGKLLKDSTRLDIAQASDFYGKQASDMAHKSRWLALIGQSLPDGKTVAQVLSEDRLRELQREANNATKINSAC